VDSTGVGDPVLEDLQRDGNRRFTGFKFHQTSKQRLMEALAVAIQQTRITFPKGPIVSELENFEFQYGAGGVRYTAPPGLHDDCVMALALAVRHWRDRRKRTSGVVSTYVGGGGAYEIDPGYIDKDTGVAPSPELVRRRIS
jgi:hypothetical protein